MRKVKSMVVRFFTSRKGKRSSLIAGFLTRNRVDYELVDLENCSGSERSLVNQAKGAPAVEVDGRMFVNPNDHALEKILHIDEQGSND